MQTVGHQASVYTVHIVMHSGLVISHADRRPMYVQIVEQVRHRIAVGDWAPGHELPSIRALAVASQVSVITIKRAYFDLEREGLIVTRQGRGSFVADAPNLGTHVHDDELETHLSAAADLARVLGLTTSDLERRLRSAVARTRTKETR
jgi:GntR family transcriptional regulator